MTMSSKQLESLIKKYPLESEAITRLSAFIEAEEQFPTDTHVFPINRLISKIMPKSALAFSEILAYLESEGILKKIFRIESPTTKAGIQDFPTIIDIPKAIHDPNVDRLIEISADDVKLLYSVIK